MPVAMDTDDDKKARLAAALRANLRKRKAQGRADAQGEPVDDRVTAATQPDRT